MNLKQIRKNQSLKLSINLKRNNKLCFKNPIKSKQEESFSNLYLNKHLNKSNPIKLTNNTNSIFENTSIYPLLKINESKPERENCTDKNAKEIVLLVKKSKELELSREQRLLLNLYQFSSKQKREIENLTNNNLIALNTNFSLEKYQKQIVHIIKENTHKELLMSLCNNFFLLKQQYDKITYHKKQTKWNRLASNLSFKIPKYLFNKFNSINMIKK